MGVIFLCECGSNFGLALFDPCIQKHYSCFVEFGWIIMVSIPLPGLNCNGNPDPTPGKWGVNTFKYKQSSFPKTHFDSGSNTGSWRLSEDSFLPDKFNVLFHGLTGLGGANLKGPIYGKKFQI